MAESRFEFLYRPRVIAAVIIGIATLVLYSITLAPDILAHDSSEWQAAAATLGISHSPGSPAYIITGWLFSQFPLGSQPARVSFISVVVGAGGVVALFVFMLMLLDRWLPALVAAASLAVAGLWWSHASVATPYNFVPAIIAVFFIMLLLWQRKGDLWLVWAGALMFGLGLGYHLTLIYFLPTVVAGLVVLGPWRKLLKPKAALLTLLFFAIGFSVYAYVPIRSAAEPPILASKVDSLSSFYRYVTAKEQRGLGYHGILRFPAASELKDRFVEVVRQGYYPSYAFLVLGPAVVLLYPAVWPSLKRRQRLLVFLAAGAAAHMLFVISFSGQFAQYYMPLLLYFAIWAGLSVWLIMLMADAYLPAGRLRLLPVALVGAIYFGVLVVGAVQKWDFANHRQDFGMRQYVNWVFENAGPDAVVMANWDIYTGLLYAQKVDGQRPDLEIRLISEQWRGFYLQARAQNPAAQILLARTLPLEDEKGLKAVGPEFFLSIKGRTYQDRSHGEPYPAAVKLYEVKS